MADQNDQIKIVLVVLRLVQLANSLVVVGYFIYLALGIRDLDIPKKEVIETDVLVVIIDLSVSTISAALFLVFLGLQHLAFAGDAMMAISLIGTGITINGHARATDHITGEDDSTDQKGTHYLLEVCCLITFCTAVLWIASSALNWRLVLLERREVWKRLLRGDERKSAPVVSKYK